LIRKAGQSALHRYYLVEGGNHVDQLYDVFPTLLRPILPCYRADFVALEEWVESMGAKPAPASTTVKRPASGDLANGCRL
ncbi:MAG: hypothetical protein JWP36_1367, partial [Paucimonas sp.]|nr:hypothetical protein [Paucimonas sp.]